MSKWKRITGGKNAIKLYHHTAPGTYWRIASDGLRPADADENNIAHGLPVVWLRPKNQTSSPPLTSSTPKSLIQMARPLLMGRRLLDASYAMLR